MKIKECYSSFVGIRELDESKEEKLFFDACMEECIKRMMAEQFCFEGWRFIGIEYEDERFSVFIFQNNDKKLRLAMKIVHGAESYTAYPCNDNYASVDRISSAIKGLVQ